MAAGDINDAASNIPGIALADNSNDPTDLGAGFVLLKFKNGLPVWMPSGGSVTYGMPNPMTTQDDIVVGGASGAATRLAKGSDSQVLTVDPATHHLAWATPAAVSSGLSLIGLTTLGSDAATLDISSIPATYKHLYLVCKLRSTTSATTQTAYFRFNADSGSHYDFAWWYWGPAGTNAGSDAAGGSIGWSYIPAASATSGRWGLATITILDYASTSDMKSVVGQYSYFFSHSSPHGATGHFGGLWDQTSAINQITFRGAADNLLSGSEVSLYGIA